MRRRYICQVTELTVIMARKTPPPPAPKRCGPPLYGEAMVGEPGKPCMFTLIARQRGWSKAETARASFQAGIGHVLSTLLTASVVWPAGAAVAARFGHVVDTAASVALVAFGCWIAISARRELRGGDGHGHSHGHGRTV